MGPHKNGVKITSRLVLAALIGGFMFRPLPAPAAASLYVDSAAAGPAHDGSSWCSAYTALQDALAAALASGGAITEIRVAQGTYQPDEGATQTAGDRLATFGLVDGVTLMGGLAGCGAVDPDERDIAVYETILSGDLGSNDGPDFADNDENSYHVVTYAIPGGMAVLDGFTVTGGNADGSGPEGTITNQGGGVHIRKGSIKCIAGGPILRNCTIRNNWAAHHGAVNDHALSTVIEDCTFRDNYAGVQGAGLLINGGSPTVTDCVFSNNETAGEGGGVWSGHDHDPTCVVPSKPIFSNCSFSENSALKGGGMFIDASEPTLQTCDFTANTSQEGGGIYSRGELPFMSARPTLASCSFSGNAAITGGAMFNYISTTTLGFCSFQANQAQSGGAIFNYWYTDFTSTNCVFSENTAGPGSGGAILNHHARTTTLIACHFRSNSATGHWATSTGGAIYSADSDDTIVNCIFSGNVSTSFGSALYAFSEGTRSVINCSFAGNATEGSGGGAIMNATSEGSLVKIRNCILWDNSRANGGTDFLGQLRSAGGSVGDVDVSYSAMQAWNGQYGGSGNISADPLLADAAGEDGIVGTPDDNLRLSPASPAINAGENTAVTVPFDLDGNPRIRGGTIDMGAYESNCLLFGDVLQTGTVDIDDILCGLQGFANMGDCPDADLMPCGGNGVIDIDDLLALLAAFSGQPACPHPCL